MLCTLLLSACAAFVHADPAPVDLDAARQAYEEGVRPLVREPELVEADVEPVAELVAALVETADAEAIALLQEDAKALAGRLEETSKRLQSKRERLREVNDRMIRTRGPERKELEEKVAAADAAVDQTDDLRSALVALRDRIILGVLDLHEKVTTDDPDAAFDSLADGFSEDVRGLYELERSVDTQRAKLQGIRDRLPGVTDAEEKADLERDGDRLAAKLSLREEALERRRALRDRRIDALAGFFQRLSKGRQGEVRASTRANLRDDAWHVRALHVEFAGTLPMDGITGEILGVMKQAAKERRSIEKELEPLREKYERALKAVQTAIKGGGVPQATVNQERITLNDLAKASRRAFGEGQVVEAATRALGRSVMAAPQDERDKALGAVMTVVERESDPVMKSSAVEALGYVRGIDEVTGTLRDIASSSRASLPLRLAAIDALVRQENPAIVDLATGELLKDREWRVRSAAMSALVSLPKKEAIPALIASLSMEVGRLVDDAEAALNALTGRAFNGNATLWKDWWGKNKESFQIGAVAAARDAAKEGESAEWKKESGGVSFYGITTRSQRILFVLDRSGSMNEAVSETLTGKQGGKRKIDAAIDQLKVAVNGLEDGALYNIITYATDVTRWQKRMQKSSTSSRKKVTRWIDTKIEAVGGTNIHDALEGGVPARGHRRRRQGVRVERRHHLLPLRRPADQRRGAEPRGDPPPGA